MVINLSKSVLGVVRAVAPVYSRVDLLSKWECRKQIRKKDLPQMFRRMTTI